LSLSANSKKHSSNFCHTTLLELGKKYISNPRKDLGGGQKFARLEKGSTPPLTPKEVETQPNSAENSPPKIHTAKLLDFCQPSKKRSQIARDQKMVSSFVVSCCIS